MAWLLNAVMGTGSSSPFDVGEPVKTSLTARGWHWRLHAGKRKAGSGGGGGGGGGGGNNSSDNDAVSIFKADVAALGNDKAVLAKHAFAKTKSLRHPHILQFLDGSDTDAEVVVITEEVTPLPDWLEKQRDPDSSVSPEQLSAVTIWGVKCVLEALGFLHSQGMVHRDVNPRNIRFRGATRKKEQGKRKQEKEKQENC